MEQEAVYVGIDVAKAQVDVTVRPTGQHGIRELVSRLKALEPAFGRPGMRKEGPW